MRYMKCASHKMIRFWFILIVIASVVFPGCKDQAFDEHYDRPDWLKGNAWELLEDRGNYTIFLKAVEKSGYKNLVQGKGIVTVMAPDDKAFEEYFQKAGISSIDELSKAEIRKLVGYHLVYYSFNRDQFANFKPYGKIQEQLSEDGLYYKHRTYSRDTISTRVDPSDGKTKTIFHKERFLPVMSDYLYATKGIDPSYNYEYFYPESSGWAGESSGFNVSNASVLEYALPTDNGYVYMVDAVVEPLETIYTELTKVPEYSSFVQLYDKFLDFWYDEQTSIEFADIGDSLFIVRHTRLPEIASEWTYNGEGGLPDFANLPDLTGEAFNVFAPSNTAIDAFFNDVWADYYSSIEDIGFLPIAYLLDNHVNQGSVVFPEEITQGKITTPYGNPIDFDPDQDVVAKKMCVNGTFYGLGSVIVPDMFTSVTGPAFRNPDYRMFLYMLDATDLVGPLMSDALNFTIFMPSDEVVSSILFENSFIYWNEGNPNVLGDEYVEVENDAGARVPMAVSSMTRFVNNHIVNAEITDFSSKQVYGTRNSFSYIYVSGDSVDTNLSFNKGGTINTSEITGDWTNGSVYTTDVVLIKESTPIKALISSTQSEFNELHHISEFGELLANAGLIQPDQELSFLLGDNFLMFAPSNEAIQAAKANGEIPTSQDSLAQYLKYYFVPLSNNSINDFPFEGFGVEGEFNTAQFQESNTFSKLTLEDNTTSLDLTDATGGTAKVISEFPGVYSDGAVYLIDNVLKSE